MEGFEALVDLVGLVAGIVFLAAVPICFLKGRTGFGWFGAVAFVVGAGAWFPLYAYLRDHGWDEWFWGWRILGLAIAVVVILAASGRARTGSWWERRHSRTGGAGGRRASGAT